ncbi:MAG: hypothetical protein AAGB13_07375 [Cyanobacteria bacterium P01_F01_bin.33]
MTDYDLVMQDESAPEEAPIAVDDLIQVDPKYSTPELEGVLVVTSANSTSIRAYNLYNPTYACPPIPTFAAVKIGELKWKLQESLTSNRAGKQRCSQSLSFFRQTPQ